MKLIAHRGNWSGKNIDYENSIHYLFNAITRGYDVEVDVFFENDQWFFGHDFPKYPVQQSTIDEISKYAWFHAKNYNTLCELLVQDKHCFFHDADEYTVTSKKFIWSYSGKFVSSKFPSVAVMPESSPAFIVPENIFGVCSDDLQVFE